MYAVDISRPSGAEGVETMKKYQVIRDGKIVFDHLLKRGRIFEFESGLGFIDPDNLRPNEELVETTHCVEVR